VFVATRHCLKRAALPALVVALGGLAGAQLVCYEGFEGYGGGVQVESGSNGSAGPPLNGGMGWGGAYDVSNGIKNLVKVENRNGISPNLPAVNYSNGEISIPGGVRALRFYDSANGSFAVRRPLGAVFEAALGETLWFSVLFRTANGGASPLANEDIFQIGFDASEMPVSGDPRVSIGSTNLPEAPFPAPCRFFARSSADPLASDFHDSLPIAAATTYLLVGQIQPAAGAYDTVNLFVNPSSLDAPGPPSATITAPSGLSTLSHAFIRTVNLDPQDAYVLDEWRIGRDYASVAGALTNLLEIIPASVPGGSPTLRWPASMPGVVLETSTTLAPDSWGLVTGTFTVAAGYSTYPVPITPGTPRGFYRLRR
jgi:hypothetical protein